MRQLTTALIFLSLAIAPAVAEPGDDERGQEIVDKYVSSLEGQRDALKGMEMDVTLEGSLPRLKKHGRMDLLRMVSRLGQITYKQINFWGDDTVKKEVIARYLTLETNQVKESGGGSVSITPENYNFKYKGLHQRNQQRVHVFELKPKRKRLGLFKGELWIDPDTYLPLRESGRLVKNPSIFLKKIEFVREYEIADGTARPKHIDSIIDTRIAGKAVIAINYSNYRVQPDLPVDEARVTQ